LAGADDSVVLFCSSLLQPPRTRHNAAAAGTKKRIIWTKVSV
jgi:hypothetical protein